MPDQLVLSVGVDATSAAKGIRDLEILAGSSAARINSISGGFGNRRAMMEFFVLLREIGRGNWSRIPGSFELMVQSAGGLKYILNPVTGIILGLAAGMYATYKWTQKTVEILSGLKVPDIKNEYIGQIDKIADAWKEVWHSVSEAAVKYESAASSAERIESATKKKYEHERKMASGNPAELASIDQREISENSLNRANEIHALNTESFQLMEQASKLGVSDKKTEEANLKALKERNDLAVKAKNAASTDANKGFLAKLVQVAMDVQFSDVTDKDYSDAKRDAKGTAERWMKEYKDFVDSAPAREEKRKQFDELAKRAAEASGKETTLRESDKDLTAAAQTEAAYAAQERAAELARKGGRGKDYSDNLVRSGNFLGSRKGQIEMLQEEANRQLREMNGHLRKIANRRETPGDNHFNPAG
jgi:hypothetical protein